MQEVQEKFYLVTIEEFKQKMGITEEVLIVIHQGNGKPLKVYIQSEVIDPEQKKLSVAEAIDNEVVKNEHT